MNNYLKKINNKIKIKFIINNIRMFSFVKIIEHVALL